MLVLALDTVHRALRAPGVWVLLALGLVVGWTGLSLAVLALGDADQQAPEMVASTTQTWAGILTIWVLTRLLDKDRTSDLEAALDASRVGEIGRGLGRWAGATVVGALGATIVGALLALQAGLPAFPLYLPFTSIMVAAAMGAWALALAAWLGAGLAMGGALGLWVLGHMPWGSAVLAPGTIGRALQTLLPHPVQAPGTARDLATTCCVVLGLLLIAVASVKTGSMVRSPTGRRPAAMG